MGKFNFVRDGIIKLPPGFRFQPTDQELIFQYLKCKVLSLPLPASIIPEINICKYDPWDLPGDLEEERYFFSNKEAKYPNGNRINRATASGYWKATGLDRKIVSSGNDYTTDNIVGMKKILVFHRGKSPHGSRTDWIMHEYRLVTIGTITNNSVQKCFSHLGSWVVCRVFLKKRSNNNVGRTDKHERVQNCKYNELMKNIVANRRNRIFEFNRTRDKTDFDSVSSSSSSSSSSSCSGMTEVSSSGEEHEDSPSSHCNVF